MQNGETGPLAPEARSWHPERAHSAALGMTRWGESSVATGAGGEREAASPGTRNPEPGTRNPEPERQRPQSSPKVNVTRMYVCT
ncbi:MAG: hypothetical protein AAFQ43_11700, partial [Bacteroidota bacterium]